MVSIARAGSVSIALSVISKWTFSPGMPWACRMRRALAAKLLSISTRADRLIATVVREAVVAPCLPLLRRFVQDVQREIPYLIAHLGDGNELLGLYHPVLRMLPARERLDAFKTPLAQTDDGLIVHLDLADPDRLAERVRQRQATRRVAVERR